MRKIDKLIEDNQDKLEDIIVPQTPYTLMDYIHGRCQVFAQALHEELGYELEFFWDHGYWFDDDDYPSTVLVHAYCILPKGVPFKGKYVDARGALSKRMMQQEYEYSIPLYEKYSIDRLEEDYKQNILEQPTKEEIKAVRNYIRENINKYK